MYERRAENMCVKYEAKEERPLRDGDFENILMCMKAIILKGMMFGSEN